MKGSESGRMTRCESTCLERHGKRTAYGVHQVLQMPISNGKRHLNRAREWDLVSPPPCYVERGEKENQSSYRRSSSDFHPHSPTPQAA